MCSLHGNICFYLAELDIVNQANITVEQFNSRKWYFLLLTLGAQNKSLVVGGCGIYAVVCYA
jgi:hypothetical protein